MAEAPLSLNTPGDIQRLLAERVRQLRLGLNLTQGDLARRAGLSLPTLQRFERTGHTSTKNLLRICHALGRLDEFEQLLRPPPAATLADLEAQAAKPLRKRARR